MHALSRTVEDCIDNCLACHKTCLGVAMTHCLETGGEHVAPQHFRMMVDCAAICATTADFMLHKSQFHHDLCSVCATVCEACARDCEGMAGMEDCAKACRTCAESCRAMAQ